MKDTGVVCGSDAFVVPHLTLGEGESGPLSCLCLFRSLQCFAAFFPELRHFDFDSVVRFFSITTSTIAIWGSLPQDAVDVPSRPLWERRLRRPSPNAR